MILTITEKKWDRKQKASLHDDAMGTKYSDLHGRMDAYADYHYWHEERIDKPGYYRWDYPLPYSYLHYFRRFAELFFSPGAEDGICPTLAYEFPNSDEVDAEYIESLLIKAEDFGFFTPGAMINFYGNVIEKCPSPPAEGQHYVLAPLKGGYRESYTGSKANKLRAKVIRQWLKSRAAALAVAPSQVILPPNSPWEPLLIGKMDLPTFFNFLTDCGLMTTDGQLTTLGQASKAPWAGTLRALMDADAKHLDPTTAAVCRALEDPAGQIGVTMNEGTMRTLSYKAEGYYGVAKSRLKELGLLGK